MIHSDGMVDGKTNKNQPFKHNTSKVSKTSTGKRKFHQKSRNGCSTCKRRRVKCDETRPVCNKCQHMKLVCGYTLEEANSDEGSNKKTRKLSESSEIKDDISNLSSNDDSSLSGESEMRSPHLLGKEVADILTAGNLNNINLSHLANSLSGLGNNFNSLGNLASLSNLATLAKLPIDLSNISNLLFMQNTSISTSNHLSASNVSPNQNQQNQPSFMGTSDFKFDVSNNSSTIPKSAKEADATKQYNAFLRSQDMLQQEGPISNQNRSENNVPNVSLNTSTSQGSPLYNSMGGLGDQSDLNMLDLRLMYHYTSQVSQTITGAGISDTNIWNHDVPMLAFNHPFLMHAMLAFSATHLSRTEKGLDQCVTCHRGEALRLLREAVLDINADNTDALVASALILIMDSLANASFPSSTSPKSLPASAWIFHVKGAATILTAVWPLTESSRFFKFISVDLGDLGDIINQKVDLSKATNNGESKKYATLECHDSDLTSLYPVEIDSPYLITLAYLSKLHKERYNSDFILRVFAFPALLDKPFLSLLMAGDITAMRIMRSYYKLLRSFTTEMKDKVWFLEGVSRVLPVDVEEYAGGAGGMHMMLDFLGGGPSIVVDEIDDEISKFDPTGSITNQLINTDNLPSDITSDLDVMQGDNGLMNIK